MGSNILGTLLKICKNGFQDTAVGDISSVATEDLSSVATEDISSVATEDISGVATEEEEMPMVGGESFRGPKTGAYGTPAQPSHG